MDRKRLTRLKRELENLASAPRGRKTHEFITLAGKLGRVKANRGKEPTYVRTEEPKLKYPLSIPNHPGDMSIGTARSIIEQLLSDADEWELWLVEQEKKQMKGAGPTEKIEDQT